jgi:hypothetical protein
MLALTDAAAEAIEGVVSSQGAPGRGTEDRRGARGCAGGQRTRRGVREQ